MQHIRAFVEREVIYVVRIMADKLTRIAIVNHDKCKPKKCRQECKKSCPVVRMGKLCIEVTPQSKIAWISETLCIGCGICIKDPPDWQEILTYFRGSELQNYFTKILEDDLKAIIKPQYVDQIPKAAKGTVGSILDRKDETKTQAIVCQQLEYRSSYPHAVDSSLVFMFDEPSSYLDVKQRLKAAITIRSLINPDRYIIVVEHDLSVLDYLSDFICCLYGVPSAYGVVTMPFSVREGINIFLDGYVPTENLRFRDASLVFKVAETANEEEVKKMCMYKYPGMKKKMGEFELAIVAGEFTDSEIMVMLGENGTGKTTFIRMLAGRLKPDEGGEVPVLNVSYKPQKISPKSTVQTLSGGELQRVALALCLGKPADVYLIDEPSAYLDSEQRLMAARVVKRFILHAKKTAFVVEHDFIMATYLADRVIVFDGIPSKNTVANRM
ncbi:hypothetical protein GH733_012018 [Mirounga leonina]|nr:hypothetical protein GH733_012018 [Mirounga leonina]